MGLNGTLLLAFIASFIGAITTAFELSNSFKYILSAIICLITIIPLVINFILFINSSHSRVLAIKREFYKIVYSDYYETIQIRKTLEGQGIYCNQSFIAPSVINGGRFYTFGHHDEFKRNMFWSTEAEKKKLLLKDDALRSSKKLYCTYEIVNKDGLIHSDNVIEVKINKSRKILINNKIRNPDNFVSATQYFKVIISKSLTVEIELRHHNLQNNKSFRLGSNEITNSFYNLEDKYTTSITMTHNESRIQNLISERLIDCNSFNNFLYSISCFQESPELGICSIIGLRRGVNVLHSNTIQDMLKNCMEGFVPILNVLEDRIIVEGDLINDDMTDLMGENLLKFFSFDSLCKKFGDKLSTVIYNHNLKFWGYINHKALNYIINHESCRRYRDIGSNFKSKKYLADISMFREKAGLPRMTWMDLKVKPSTHGFDYLDSVEICDKKMESLIQVRHLDDFKEEKIILNETKDVEISKIKVSSTREEKRELQENINSISKQINDISNYENKVSGFFNKTNIKRYQNFIEPNLKLCSSTDHYLKALKKPIILKHDNKPMETLLDLKDIFKKTVDQYKKSFETKFENKLKERQEELKSSFISENKRMTDDWVMPRNAVRNCKMNENMSTYLTKNPFEVIFEEDFSPSVDVDVIIKKCLDVKTKTTSKKMKKLSVMSDIIIDKMLSQSVLLKVNTVDVHSFVKQAESNYRECNKICIKGFFKKIKRRKIKKSFAKKLLKMTKGLVVGAKRKCDSYIEHQEKTSEMNPYRVDKKIKSVKENPSIFKRSMKKLLKLNLLGRRKRLGKEVSAEQIFCYKERIKNEIENKRLASNRRETERYMLERRIEKEERLKRIKIREEMELKKKLEKEEREKNKVSVNVYRLPLSSDLEYEECLDDVPRTFSEYWIKQHPNIKNINDLFAEFREKCNEKSKEADMIRNLSESELSLLDEDTQIGLIMLAQVSV